MENPSIHIGAESVKITPQPFLETDGPKASWMDVANDYLIHFQRIKITDKVTFFRLLATMINAGISIVKALTILEDQTDNKHMKLIVHDLVIQIESGGAFSKALSTYPKYFSEAQIGMVEAGEASGQLNQTLAQIADQAEKEAAFRARVKGAMIYPLVILSLMAVAFVVVMVVVMPQIKEMFEGLGGTLPTMTLILIAISDFFVAQSWGISNALWILFGLLIFAYLFSKWKNTVWGAYAWTRFVFALPIFGKLSKKASLAHFARSLSTMVGSGIPIIKALRISAASVGNSVYQKRIGQVADDVKHGISMAENMKDDLYYFPSMIVGMMGVAEQTAQIDKISQKIATYYEDEVDNMVKSLSSLMEPVIMVVIGSAVGFLVIAVMEPILSASDLVV